MNKLLITILILFCSITIKAQTTSVLAEEQIKLVMSFQESNWNRGNISDYMKGYWNSDSLLFIGSKGATYGYSKTLLNYLKSYPTKEKMGKLTFDIIKVDLITEKDAFVVGKWKLTRKEDTIEGHYTLLWKKIDGEWKIVVDHSS